MYATGYRAFDDLGAPWPGTFIFGLPFFYGRRIFFGFEETTIGSAAGPFFAY